MYEILRAYGTDIGSNTEAILNQTLDDLAAQVNAKDGYEPVGSHQITIKSRPHGAMIVASQAVRKAAGTAATCIRHSDDDGTQEVAVTEAAQGDSSDKQPPLVLTTVAPVLKQFGDKTFQKDKGKPR